MFRNIPAAAVIWMSLALGASAGRPSPTVPSSAAPPSITTEAAYQSWLTWYRIHPQAPADAGGARFRQLLSAMDGDLYFLKGLDEASPQIRELSKQGLIQSPTIRSYLRITARLDSSNQRVCRQAQEILAVHRLSRRTADECADGDSTIAPSRDIPSLRALPSSQETWQAFSRGVAFGGMMRIALTGGQLDTEQCGDCRDNGLDPDTLGLVTAIRKLEFSFGLRFDERQHLKRLLAAAKRRRASTKSAAKLLDLLDQTTQSSPLDDVTVEQLKQALAQHVGQPANLDQQPSSGQSPNWPGYRLRIELECQVNAQPTSVDGSEQQEHQMFESNAAPPRIHVAGSLVGRHASDAFDSASDLAEIVEQFAPGALADNWANCPLTGFDTLAPGTYKLLVTFEPSPDSRSGFGDNSLGPKKVGAIVFQVKPRSEPSTGAVMPLNPLAKKSVDEAPAWQILHVAFSDSTASWDDLCTPAPSTLALRMKPDRQQLVNFTICGGR